MYNRHQREWIILGTKEEISATECNSEVMRNKGKLSIACVFYDQGQLLLLLNESHGVTSACIEVDERLKVLLKPSKDR